MSNRIITIEREYASGGREVGELVAKQLGIPFYNREIYLLFLINAMITAITPTHSHIIPFTVFPAKNQTKEKSIHIITKIIIPLLLIYFLLHKFKFVTFYILYFPRQ